jgi:Protein of unknown function (DUF2946)
MYVRRDSGPHHLHHFHHFHHKLMDTWVENALKRWPNVPALFGWLGLDHRGRWLIQGEPISHARIVQTINRNYGVDEHGRWYFQNGPQRGYIELEYAPFVLRREQDGFMTHNELRVERPTQAILDEVGTLSLSTEHGLGEIYGGDLDWVLERLSIDHESIDEEQIASLLDLPSETETDAVLAIGRERLPVVRINAVELPNIFSFVRNPEPQEGERFATRAPD